MTINELLINGRSVRVDADGDRTLLSVLRDDLDFVGAKYGCGEGECGACTVHVDGAAVRSCQRKVGSLGGKSVITIEGLTDQPGLSPLQQAFLDAGALQCGYCTPGMIMSAQALLNRNPNPSEPEIRRAMEGNICRCGTYHRIVTAIVQAVRSANRGK